MFSFFATLWTVVHQVPLSMGFSRQEHWSGLPCPPPGDLPDPGIQSASLMSPALAGDSLPLEPPGKPNECLGIHKVRSANTDSIDCSNVSINLPDSQNSPFTLILSVWPMLQADLGCPTLERHMLSSVLFIHKNKGKGLNIRQGEMLNTTCYLRALICMQR